MINAKIGPVSQVIFGGTLLTIAGTAGAVGMWMNVLHGLELRPEAGILFGAADATKIILPIVCGLVGWSLHTRLVAVVCVLTSLFCAATAFNTAADRNLDGKSHQAAQYTDAKAQVARLEASLSSLMTQAAAEAKNKGCGSKCKFFTGEAEKARVELAAARTDLNTAKPVSMTGNEKLTAWITALLFLVLIESLIWLSVPAMQLISQAITKPAPKATVRKSRKVAKKAKTTTKQIAALKKAVGVAGAPRMTKSGKIDGRTRAAKAVKRVTNTRMVIA